MCAQLTLYSPVPHRPSSFRAPTDLLPIAQFPFLVSHHPPAFPLRSVPRQVRRPAAGPAGPAQRHQGAPVQRSVRVSRGQLREGECLYQLLARIARLGQAACALLATPLLARRCRPRAIYVTSDTIFHLPPLSPVSQDLSLLGRDARYTIIVDNSPASYIFQPENALACDSFIDDRNDSELFVLLEFLEEIRRCKDVRPVLGQWAQGLYGGPRTLSLHSDSEGEGGGAGAYHEALGFGSAGDESEGDDAAVVGGGNGEGGAGGNAHNLTTATHAAAVGTTSHSSNSIVAGMSNARIGNNNNNSGGGGDGKASYEDDHTEVHYQHQPQQQLRKLSSGQSRQAIQQQQQQQQQSGMQRQTSGADRGHNYRGQWA